MQGILRVIKMGSSPKPIGKVCRGSDNSTVLDYQELPKQVTKGSQNQEKV